MFSNVVKGRAEVAWENWKGKETITIMQSGVGDPREDLFWVLRNRYKR